jgi:hypothetical protein
MPMTTTTPSSSSSSSSTTVKIPKQRKSIVSLIGIIIGIATLHQKYQLALILEGFQNEPQFLYMDKTSDDKINIKPFKVHENITTERNNQLNSNQFENENTVTLFDKNSKYQNCWLSSVVNLLGCGYDGHGFLATMNCPHPITNTNINQYDVVLKMRHASNHTEEGRQNIFKSESDSSLKSLVETHHLLMDNTTTRIRQYFALPIGTANIQKNLLLKTVYTNNKERYMKKQTPKWCNRLMEPKSSATTTDATSSTTVTYTTNDETDETLTGTIMVYSGSNQLHPPKLTDPDNRRRVVKDLVCTYRHMYRVSENQWIGNVNKYHLKSCSVSNYLCCSSSSS